MNYLSHPLIRENTVQSRIYQQILYGVAIKDNTLIVLPTGLGKTVVFIMVIAHYLKSDPNSSVVITAPTRPLVNQHFDSCVKMLHLDLEDIIIISGEHSPEDRDALWRQGRVFIATPQTLRNDIISKRVDLTSISLMCFDEAHRAIGDDPYVLCAEQYVKLNPKGRRLGFTASPGNKEKIFEILANLSLSQFEYMDEDHPQVKPYVHDVTENWIWVDLPEEFKKIQDMLENLIKSHLQNLKDIGAVKSIVISNNPKRSLLGIPKYMNQHRQELSDDEFFSGMASYGQLMLLYLASEMLETQGIHTLMEYIQGKEDEFSRTKKSSLRRFLQSPEIQQILSLSQSLVASEQFHPKLKRLKEIVNNQLSTNPESRILVFANYKSTTQFLVNQLNRLDDTSVHRFVGQSNSARVKGLSQKEQKEIMSGFRSGEYNILVSTSVGEEGLDVAQCDLVIFYDVTPSATRLIQRSGRTGRARKGQVVILITRGTRDEGYFYASRRQKNKIKSSIGDIKQELRERGEKKRQTDLANFFDDTEQAEEEPPEKDNQTDLVILVDHRERGSGIMRTLLQQDVRVEQASLPVGDFLLSSRVAVERKTISDFSSTLMRGDLFDQLITLKSTFEKPILLIEGDLFATTLSHQAVLGAFSSVIVDYNIPVINTIDEKDTVDRLLVIARREQERADRKPTIRSNKSTSSLLEEQLYLLSSLPNINSILAERILEEFNSPAAFFSASVDEMRKVQGIGPQIARRIRDLLDQRELS